MILAGDYVRIKNKEGYEGKVGKVLGWRPLFEIELIDSKKIIYCDENEVEKISRKEVEEILKPKIQKNYINLVQNFQQLKKFDDKIKETLVKLKEFNEKYPFKKNPTMIEDLTTQDLFIENSNQMGNFFHWIVYRLKELGNLNLRIQVYREASNNLETFKELLYIVVDPKISLADKVDAPWENIKGMGLDKHLAKKIICSFNTNLIPIFNTEHLEHYFNKVIGRDQYPPDYKLFTLGQRYEFLMDNLLKVKNDLNETKSWENVKYSTFLYKSIPPPGKEKRVP